MTDVHSVNPPATRRWRGLQHRRIGGPYETSGGKAVTGDPVDMVDPRWAVYTWEWAVALRVLAKSVVVLTIFAAFVLAIGGAGFAVERHRCNRGAQVVGTEGRWGWAEGCYYRFDDDWVPVDQWRVNTEPGVFEGDDL